MSKKLTLLFINHRHGTDTIPCSGQKELDKKLAEYVDENWDDSPCRNQTKPKNKKAAVKQYFESREDEHWEAEDVDVTWLWKKWTDQAKKEWARWALAVIDDEADIAGINNHIGYDQFFKAVAEELNG